MVELHAYAIVLLALVLALTYQPGVTASNSLGLFRLMTVTIMVNLACETILWFYGSFPLSIAYPGTWILNSLIYALTPFATMVFVFYADSILAKPSQESISWKWPWFVPVIINGFLILTNFWTSWLFNVSPGAEYSRGPLFLVSALMSYTYLGGGIIHLFLHRQWISRREMDYFILYILLPVTGGILQILSSYWLTWSAFALANVFIYITIQDKNLSIEPLTGLKARRYLIGVMDQHIRDAQRTGVTFMAHLIDLDGFKQINDTYGHGAGDKALVLFARLLNESFRMNDVVCRFGGDEFVILMEPGKEAISSKALQRLENKILDFNASGAQPWKLNYSVGSMKYECETHATHVEFLHCLDQAMYERKKNKRK